MIWPLRKLLSNISILEYTGNNNNRVTRKESSELGAALLSTRFESTGPHCCQTNFLISVKKKEVYFMPQESAEAWGVLL